MRVKVVLVAIIVAVVGAVAFFPFRSTPLDHALASIQGREYFFDEDRDADPGLSPTRATSMAASEQTPSVGPVAGLLTHDSPGRGNDLNGQPVYLFVVDEFHHTGPVLPGRPPGPSPHVVFVYAEGGAHSVIGIPLED